MNFLFPFSVAQVKESNGPKVPAGSGLHSHPQLLGPHYCLGRSEEFRCKDLRAGSRLHAKENWDEVWRKVQKEERKDQGSGLGRQAMNDLMSP